MRAVFLCGLTASVGLAAFAVNARSEEKSEGKSFKAPAIGWCLSLA